MPIMRLDKFLSNMGVDSRKGVRAYFKDGAIKVDGIVVKERDMKIDTCKNTICLYDEEIIYRRYMYLMMNKPAGVISATDDPYSKERTVIDLLPEEYEYFDLFPVGRLDKDTIGLLLLTNDGLFAHRTLSPKKHVPKIYKATINSELSQKDIEAFHKGVKLEDGTVCLPSKLTILSSGNTSEAEITIIEGKYHQIKRMFEAVDKKVLFLQRIQFGDIVLDETLAEGGVRQLNDNEMESISNYISNDN